MVVHHWVTVLLIVCSWFWGAMPFGAVVMVCHDNADFFLAAAKITRYHNWLLAADINFGLFFISWIGCRMILYTIKVVWPITFYRGVTHSCNPLQWAFIIPLYILLVIISIFVFFCCFAVVWSELCIVLCIVYCVLCIVYCVL